MRLGRPVRSALISSRLPSGKGWCDEPCRSGGRASGEHRPRPLPRPGWHPSEPSTSGSGRLGVRTLATLAIEEHLPRARSAKRRRWGMWRSLIVQVLATPGCSTVETRQPMLVLRPKPSRRAPNVLAVVVLSTIILGACSHASGQLAVGIVYSGGPAPGVFAHRLQPGVFAVFKEDGSVATSGRLGEGENLRT